MKIKYKKIFIPFILLAGFFVFKNVFAVDKSVFISEIAWMGGVNSSNDEWMKLKNNTDKEINLEGWRIIAEDGSPDISLSGKLKAGGFYVLERSDDDSLPGVAADIIYTGALSNSGEYLKILNDSGNIVDEVDMSGGWTHGDNETKATMKRSGDYGWYTENTNETNEHPASYEDGASENNENELLDDAENTNINEDESLSDTEESESAPPLVGTGQAPPLTRTGQADEMNEEGVSEMKKYGVGDVVINEFVSDPEDGEVEWIELYNNLKSEISLDLWTIEDGSGAVTKLSGKIGFENDDRYFVTLKPKGNLNNKGDVIILRDGSGSLIDRVVYGDWGDDTASNAPFSKDPYCVARKINGYSSFNNKNDFAISELKTKGKSNIIKISEDEEGENNKKNLSEINNKSDYDYSENIFISEIFPNPEGVDYDDEFIELYNGGDKAVSLKGWMLGDESKKRFSFKENPKDQEKNSVYFRESNMIASGAYLVVYRKESGIALNNNKDSVKLFRPLEEEPFSFISYGKAEEGWSYNLKDGDYFWSEIISPGKENIVKTINIAPEVAVLIPEKALVGKPLFFDSSDTYDKEGDELLFLWDFGDGFLNSLPCPEHTYFKEGIYNVILKVSDGENEVIKEFILAILSQEEYENGEIDYSADNYFNKNEYKIIINEFLPDPDGSDLDGEWIELKNIGEEEADLIEWSLDDSEDGSRSYKFKLETLVKPGGFYFINRKESGIALNNNFDSVRLLNPLGDLVDSVFYEETFEGKSYARGENNKFFWTNVLSPGEENIISVKDVASMDIKMAGNIGNNILSKAEVNISSYSDDKEIFYGSIKEALELEAGSLVITKGVVSVLPGILGAQYFYISELKNPAPSGDGASPASYEDGASENNEVKSTNETNEYEINEGESLRTLNNTEDAEDESLKTLKKTEDAEKGDEVGGMPEEGEEIKSESADFNPGIQVYNYKKDFPNLKVGDYIEVIGEISVSYGEKRIKTKTLEDFVVLEKDKDIFINKIVCEEIDESMVGGVVKINGQIVEKKGSSLYVDDGSDEAKVYVKADTGINLKSFEEGDEVEVIAIAGLTKSGIRFLPREEDDIVIVKNKTEDMMSDFENGEVLGEFSESLEWNIDKRDKKLELFKYLLIISLGIIFVLGGMLYKEVRREE
jgi:hypothetical protein